MSKSLRLLTAIARHGDRAPVLLASESHSALSAKETDYWTSVLVDKSVQPTVHNANAHTFDHTTYPLGNLTVKGAGQCQERGKRLAARYRSAGISLHPSGLRVRASNYRRTQLSAHYLSTGLLAGGGGAGSTEASLPTPITVSPSASCSIGTFESEVGLMKAAKELFGTELYQRRERHLSHLSQALREAIPYFAHTPGVQQAAATPASASSPVIAKVAVGDDGTAGSRWMWIRCADVFTTHRAHRRPLGDILGSYVHGHHGPVAQFEDLVHEHLLWRFRTLFTQAHILPLAIGGLLKELQSSLHAAVIGGHQRREGVEGNQQDTVPMDVIGGHDVTLQPLLYAVCMHAHTHSHGHAHTAAGSPPSEYERLQAQVHRGVFVRYDSGRSAWLRSPSTLVHAIGWPRYASCVSFELHTPPPAAPALHPGSPAAIDHAQGEALVRWVWDNEELSGDEDSAALPTPVESEPREGEYLDWAERARSEKVGKLPKLIRPDRACYMEGVMSLRTFDQLVQRVHGPAPS